MNMLLGGEARGEEENQKDDLAIAPDDLAQLRNQLEATETRTQLGEARANEAQQAIVAAQAQ